MARRSNGLVSARPTCSIALQCPASAWQSPLQTAAASGAPGQSWWKTGPRTYPTGKTALARTCVTEETSRKLVHKKHKRHAKLIAAQCVVLLIMQRQWCSDWLVTLYVG